MATKHSRRQLLYQNNCDLMVIPTNKIADTICKKKGGKWRVVCEWVETVFYAYGWVMTIVARRWVQTIWIVACYLTTTFSPIMYLLKAILFWKTLFDINGKWIGISANFIHLCLKLLLWMCQGNSEFLDLKTVAKLTT